MEIKKCLAINQWNLSEQKCLEKLFFFPQAEDLKSLNINI